MYEEFLSKVSILGKSDYLDLMRDETRYCIHKNTMIFILFNLTKSHKMQNNAIAFRNVLTTRHFSSALCMNDQCRNIQAL